VLVIDFHILMDKGIDKKGSRRRQDEGIISIEWVAASDAQ
jgi:hypothetical protein